MSEYSSKLQADAEYQKAIDRYVYRLIREGAFGRVPDRDPRPPSNNVAFHVEFATPVIDFNPLAAPWTTGDDVTMAIGTGHFGHIYASLVATTLRSTSSEGWLAITSECVTKVVFRAQMIQYDSFSFYSSYLRERNPWYHAGAELQRAGLKPVKHFETWTEQRTYYVLERSIIFITSSVYTEYRIENSEGDWVTGVMRQYGGTPPM